MEQVREDKREERARPEKAANAALLLCAKTWDIVRLNLLFVAFSIPVLTIPATLSGMTKVLMNTVRNGDADIWGDFFAEFKTGFLKSLKAGLAAGLPLAAAVFAGYAAGVAGGLAGTLGAAFAIVSGVYLYAAGCYLFPLLAAVDLRVGQCVKNAFLLPLAEIKRSALLVVPLALMAAAYLLLPYSFPLLLFAMFALCQMIVCRIVDPVIQKRIIAPYYAGK
jgi:uncharacterized membrane protein YesL